MGWVVTPGALPPDSDPVPTEQKARWVQGRSGRLRNISPLTEVRAPNRPARSESLHRTQLISLVIPLQVLYNCNGTTYQHLLISYLLPQNYRWPYEVLSRRDLNVIYQRNVKDLHWEHITAIRLITLRVKLPTLLYTTLGKIQYLIIRYSTEIRTYPFEFTIH
jgi:hypothetical protein